MRKTLFVSLENDEAGAGEVVAPDTVTAAESDAETAVVEVTEAVADIHEDLDLIEESVAEIETLEDHSEVLEESLAEDGEGIDEAHAETLNISVERILARLNYPKKVTIATENYGSINTRKQATQVSLEALSDTLVELWKKLKEFVSKIWESITKFFADYFTQLGRVKQAIVDVKKKVAAAQGAPKEKNIVNKSLVRAFYDFKSKSVKLDEIVANHMEVTKDGLKVADGLASLADAQASYLKMLNGAPTEDASAKLGETATKIMEMAIKGNESGPYFNGSFFTLETAEKEASAGKFAISFPTFKINTISGEVKAEGLPALDKAGCGKCIQEAEQLATLTEQFKTKQSKLDAFRKSNDKMNDAVIAFIKSTDDKEAEDKKKYLAELRKYSLNVSQSYSRLFATIPSYNLNVVKALLNYVQASVKNLGEGEAAPKKEETKQVETK